MAEIDDIKQHVINGEYDEAERVADEIDRIWRHLKPISYRLLTDRQHGYAYMSSVLLRNKMYIEAYELAADPRCYGMYRRKITSGEMFV